MLQVDVDVVTFDAVDFATVVSGKAGRIRSKSDPPDADQAPPERATEG